MKKQTSELITEIAEQLLELFPDAQWTFLDSGAGRVTVITPAGFVRFADCGGLDADDARHFIGRACLEHEHGKLCPVTAAPFPLMFSDSTRPGFPFNACHYCHADKRSIAERLRDLNKKRAQ